ncbi:MAG: class II aldolase/adducin family protein, partial [Planctomycetes bacterium]|nr:class II aldolase/adducin family protein [Planctomycetota bacterium]
ALRDIPIYGTTHADHLPTPVPCTPLMADDRVENDYEAETGRQIVDCFAARGLAPTVQQMALVGGHGPFAWGATAAKAVYSARVLEELAKMAFITETVNPRAQLLKPSIINKHYLRKHGKDAYYGQQH